MGHHVELHHYSTVQEFPYFIGTPLRLVASFKKQKTKKILNIHQQLVQCKSRLLTLSTYSVGLLNEVV